MTNDNNYNLIPSGHQKLAKYSSDLIKKGLNLANQINTSDNQPSQSLPKSANQAKVEELLKQALEKYSLGDFQGSLAYFAQALKINPDYYIAYILRASLIHAPLGNHQAVIEDYSQVLRLNPNNSEAYKNRGFAHASLGDHWEAIEDYDRALEIAPCSIQTYMNRGISYFSLEDYEEAISDFEQVLRTDPYNANAYNNRGFSYFIMEDYENALDDFNIVLQIDPNHFKAYLNRSYTHIYLNEYLEAIEDFEQALKLDSECIKEYLQYLENILKDRNLEGARETIAHGLLLKGNEHYEIGNYQEAIENYNKVLQIDANYSPAYILRSKIRIEIGDVSGGMEDYIQFLLLEGQSCINSEDYQRAIEAYTRVLEIDPNNLEAYNRRMIVRLLLGDDEGAEDDLKMALDISLELNS